MQNTILRGRYKITKTLGRGRFGETYLAEDLDRPSQPRCVVKKLHATFNSDKDLEVAKRFFNNEAQVLYNLGDRSCCYECSRRNAGCYSASFFFAIQAC